MKQSVKKGEEVVVISGSAKGKRGKVLAVMPSKGRVIVEGETADTCVCCGKQAKHVVLFARAY